MKNFFICGQIKFDKHKQIKIIIPNDLLNYFNGLNMFLNSGLTYKKNQVDKIIDFNQGLILCGGGDISKIKKNKESVLRDKFEKFILKKFIEKNKPVLCICRGFQLLSSINKGKFIKSSLHVRTKHLIKIENNSKYINYKKLNINSYHNYNITHIDLKKFNIVAKTIDGSIEIAEHKIKKILCIMFHPERKNISQKKINKIIKNFFK